MTSEKDKSVLIVDDSIVDMQFLVEVLQEEFSILTATNGEQALQLLEQGNDPDIILLDIYMQGMSGYETCETIINQYANKDIIFVSANDSTEEILQGYAVGGIDYIVKPFDSAVLVSKISLAIRNREIQNNLKESQESVTKMAMTAMNYSGELGVIIDFQKQCFFVNDIHDLCETVMEFVSQDELNCCVQIVQGDKLALHSDNGVLCELETERMLRAKDMDERFIVAGTRTFIRYEDIVILVKNMPIDNEEKMGRLRDNLLILAENAQNRIKSFAVAEKHIKPVVCDYNSCLSDDMKSEISSLVNSIEVTFESLEKEGHKYTDQSVKIVESIIREIENAFPRLGLAEYQETELLSIINNSVDKSINHHKEDIQLDHQLKYIASQLSGLSAMQ